MTMPHWRQLSPSAILTGAGESPSVPPRQPASEHRAAAPASTPLRVGPREFSPIRDGTPAPRKGLLVESSKHRSLGARGRFDREDGREYQQGDRQVDTVASEVVNRHRDGTERGPESDDGPGDEEPDSHRQQEIRSA